MNRRLIVVGSAALALVGVACLDMSAPKSGVASLSPLILPSPSVVVNDVMRDSTGAPAPLRIIAFDQGGDTLSGVKTTFFVLDPGAHVDDAGLLYGDSLTTVRIVGEVAGVQTSIVTLTVTASPDTAINTAPGGDTLHISTDTTRSRSSALSLKLQSMSGAPAQGFVVHYQVVYAPPTAAGETPAVYIGNDASALSPVDTTDAAGTASHRYAYLRLKAIAGTPDSVVVEATVQYKGLAVRGSPLRYVIPVRLP